jgi:hypothetical protein
LPGFAEGDEGDLDLRAVQQYPFARAKIAEALAYMINVRPI